MFGAKIWCNQPFYLIMTTVCSDQCKHSEMYNACIPNVWPLWVYVCTWWSEPCEPRVSASPQGWTAWPQASQTSVWSTDTGPGHWWTWTQPLCVGNMPSEKHNILATRNCFIPNWKKILHRTTEPSHFTKRSLSCFKLSNFSNNNAQWRFLVVKC